jgi:hypothetical protein
MLVPSNRFVMGWSVSGIFLRFAFVCTLAVVATGCERSVAGACTNAQDAALKVAVLADDLNDASSAGRLDAARIGDLGARIMEAGTRFGATGNHQSYCTAIEKIRSDAFIR